MPFGLGKSDKQDEDSPAVVDAPEADEAPQGPDAAPEGGSPAIGGNGVSPTAFRPDFLEPSALAERARPLRPPRTDTFFVTIERNGSTEVHRFDDAADAQGFVGQALEEGVPEEKVAAFGGARLALKVSHRPAVKLVGSDSE